MAELGEELKSLIKKRVEDRGIVVWYDPDGIYESIFEELDEEDILRFRYQESFFELRREADGLLEGASRPKAVIYVPLDKDDAGHALVELEKAGTRVYPGAPTGRNTRLEVIARAVLKKHLPEAKVDEMCRQISESKLYLDDVESIIEDASRVVPEVLKLIFGTDDPLELALSFLSDDKFDTNISRKGACGKLSSLLSSRFGLKLDEGVNPEEMRKELRRAALLGEFIASLLEEAPQGLALYLPPQDKAQRALLLKLPERWRQRKDLELSYEEAADLTEGEFHLASMQVKGLSAKSADTFRSAAEKALNLTEELILGENSSEALELLQDITASFWHQADAKVALRCSLLRGICELIADAGEIMRVLKRTKLNAEDMVARYSSGEKPWFHVDKLQRETEQRYEKYDIGDDDDEGRLEKVMAKARQSFSEAGTMMTEKFQEELKKGGFSYGKTLQQREVFKQAVAPLMEQGGKLAYMCVDALRYEMAIELTEELEKKNEVELFPAVAALPTVTGVGMAALLPGAEDSISLALGSGNMLGLDVNGKNIISRDDRIKYLEARLPGIMALNAEELQKLTKKTREALQGAEFAYVTSQEIDSLCEAGNDSLARSVMDELLSRLRRAIRSLMSCGFDKIVITADHGYLFGEAVESGMKIDPPGGSTEELKQRVWIGAGGAASDSFLRVKEMDLGMDGGYELAFPRGTASFKKKGGGKSYFHGGISLQEMVIPVLVLRAGEEAAMKKGRKKPEIALSLGRAKVGRYFMVRVEWPGQSSLMEEELRLKAVLKIDGKEKGKAIAASYGFDEASGEFAIKKGQENTVTVIVDESVTGQHTGILHLTDAETGSEVARLEGINIDITF